MARIAMWSGPRNLSTAMMYAFAARGDCEVVDEPFYGAYLAATGADHPMRADVLAALPTDPQVVAGSCARRVAGDAAHVYMKHMAHHMVDGFPLDWAEGCLNVHLIRHPARVIASYAAKRDALCLEDVGFAQQARIWRALPGPVIDSDDIRRDPRAMLGRLCAVLSVPFTEAMLHWEPGPKPFDGPWAAHWYDAVHRSTGFAPPEGALPEVTDAARDILETALPIYEQMKTEAIAPP